jgi:hypothetical protein
MSKENKIDNKIKYHFCIDKDGDLAMVSDTIKKRFKDIPPMKCALMIKEDNAHEFGYKLF